MTFYVILKWENNDWINVTDDPEHYLTAKKKMQELKKLYPKIKYRLIKTSY